MRLQPSSWTNLATKLGISGKSKSSKSSNRDQRKLRFELCEERRMLAVFVVDSELDNTTRGDGLLTLREAVHAANQSTDVDTIIQSTSLLPMAKTESLSPRANSTSPTPKTNDTNGYQRSRIFEVSVASSGGGACAYTTLIC